MTYLLRVFKSFHVVKFWLTSNGTGRRRCNQKINIGDIGQCEMTDWSKSPVSGGGDVHSMRGAAVLSECWRKACMSTRGKLVDVSMVGI